MRVTETFGVARGVLDARAVEVAVELGAALGHGLGALVTCHEGAAVVFVILVAGNRRVVTRV